MKKTIYGASIFLGLGLLMTSCFSSSSSKDLEQSLKELEKELNTVNYVESEIDSLDFTMVLPDYMVATSTLDADRPFQFMNAVKEQYLVASYEMISDVQPSLEALNYEGKTLLDQYVSYNKEVIEEGVTISKQEPVKKMKIDGMDAQMLQFDGTVEGISEGISYYTVFIQAKDRLYFIMTWTLESRKDDFKPIAEKMIKSFHLKKSA
ncbi:MAG: hypothetical protein A3D31_05630 [Candidatus Fluviicola riflensis]|nr:MAG: hypothetical protein CHH17_09385 [Candidatus Fluviicola riflensis]OGS79449.1 MAG: hypothetical protein A3D31_05630 [Candidatus Fluviicola riflensis]OGS86880.1 MAG: hypothetical protein A2724_05090 [Fluviicola sp. RIFCSPHIGHO2_01_FULL_43_53]OGS89671.1 MAG: hypothetical protein A3E30_01835 [Fluviicola sp. RIFCSPHIGHO2_12_FULL_43_24]